jgi:hypothetical protein
MKSQNMCERGQLSRSRHRDHVRTECDCLFANWSYVRTRGYAGSRTGGYVRTYFTNFQVRELESWRKVGMCESPLSPH